MIDTICAEVGNFNSLFPSEFEHMTDAYMRGLISEDEFCKFIAQNKQLIQIEYDPNKSNYAEIKIRGFNGKTYYMSTEMFCKVIDLSRTTLLAKRATDRLLEDEKRRSSLNITFDDILKGINDLK